jgi:subtilase family serine protease
MKSSIARYWAVAFALLLPFFMLTTASAAGPQAKSLGLENPGKVMNVHVMLNLRNPERFKALTQQLHTNNSLQPHQFLSKEEFAAQFAPSDEDSKKVADYLQASGLKVTHIGKNNLVVSATGTVAAMQKAFNTQIEQAQLNGETFNRPLKQPALSPSISGLVKQVSGLNTMKAQSHLVQPVKFKNKKPIPVAPVPLAKMQPKGVFFPGDCFSKNNDVLKLSGSGLQAIYSGNQYPDAACGYSPAEMQHAYGFDTVIQSGNDGTGQIITIVDPYGSPTIAEDANTFSSIYGLPALVSGGNFFVINNPTGGTPDCVESPSNQCGWELETTLDVEWAHAMAPGATIYLVNPPTAYLSDLWATDYYIITNYDTGTVSHSFGAPESQVYDNDYPDFADQYIVNYIAAELGVSMNYSSGDNGDLYPYGDYAPYTDVYFPAGSPDAVSVGGTSLALTSTGDYKWEEGWGTNATLINYAPPVNVGFIFGAGGGTSLVGTPPNYAQQYFLGNTYRQQPDVAMDADPFTGVEVIYTGDWTPGDPKFATVVGGTSLSCPMFSAVWALVEQRTGQTRLGNAAVDLYILYGEYPGTLRDTVPTGSGHNAHGTVFYGNTPVAYSQWDLAQPYQNSMTFYESIWNAQNLTLTFGTDTSLFTALGWDNVTGVGTPNGAVFMAPF